MKRFVNKIIDVIFATLAWTGLSLIAMFIANILIAFVFNKLF